MKPSTETLDKILHGAPFVVLQGEIDPNGAISLTVISGSVPTILGCDAAWLEAAPNRLFALIDPDDRSSLESMLGSAAVGWVGGASAIFALAAPTADGVKRRIVLQRQGSGDAATTSSLWSVFVIPVDNSEPIAQQAPQSHEIEALVSNAVMAERARVEEAVFVDSLTNLPNRAALQRMCEGIFARIDPEGEPIQWAFLLVDLDRFRVFNDTYGTEIGDGALKAVAAALMQVANAADLVGRLEQDSFLIASDCQSKSHHPWSLAREVLDIFEKSFHIDGNELHLSASIGVVSAPESGINFESILDRLDQAARSAKSNGRRTFAVMRSGAVDMGLERAALETDLRNAVLEPGTIEVHYQPQVNLQTGALVGVEALARWNHPEKGLIPPDVFVPIAEETGLIVQLGDWLLQTACAHAVSLFQGAYADLKLAVNLSPIQFRDPTLRDRITSSLMITGLPARCLELEITESSLMHDTNAVAETLNGLTRLGLQVAVDDFGTGYSSLSYLKNLPVNVLKLDKSFVSGIPDDKADSAICAGVIWIAHGLGLSVVAEGVESEAQAKTLASMGCEIAQGFLYGKPMPVRGLRGWLDNTRDAG